MKQLILFLLLIASGAALADPDTPTRLSQLKAELHSVQQGQQSAYQNYQMTKELRRIEVQEGDPLMAQHDINTPPPNYEDVLRARQEQEERIRQYTSDMSQLSASFMALEKQRKLILKQIQELERYPDE